MEPCFIWQNGCSNGEAYAAWAQAIFSVAAIFFSVWMVRSAERQRIADNDKQTDIYLMCVRAYLIQMIGFAQRSDFAALNNFARKMGHARERGRYIEHGLLPYSAAISIAAIDDSADRAIMLTGIVTAAADFQQLANTLQWELDKVEEAEKLIRKAIRKRKWWKRNREIV